MQDLRLIGVHEDGEHLLLSDADGGRFRVRVDEPLRTAVRHDRPRLGQQQVDADASLRPRDVQALIRAGSSAEEVAERSGWSVDKVRRYEGPILAEREHVAGLSRGVRVRGRSSGAGAPTLSVRVGERLKGRGVDPSAASWDAWREEGGPWTVVVTFAAGGRQRQASWHFDLADRTVTAIDDEARWLSEEEEPVPGPIPAPHLSQGPGRTTTVYDVEAEGGLRAAERPAAAATVETTDAERPARAERGPEPLDLMTAMRERSTARGRRKSGARRGTRKSPTNVPGAGEHVPDDAVPLEDMAYDPETMPPPPAAHAHPDLPDPLDARPEPEAAAWAEAAGLALDDVAPAPLAARRRGGRRGARGRRCCGHGRRDRDRRGARVGAVAGVPAPHRRAGDDARRHRGRRRDDGRRRGRRVRGRPAGRRRGAGARAGTVDRRRDRDPLAVRGPGARGRVSARRRAAGGR